MGGPWNISSPSRQPTSQASPSQGGEIQIWAIANLQILLEILAMCQLSRESEPVCPLGVREDMHSLLFQY